jgi:hypothetical protein
MMSTDFSSAPFYTWEQKKRRARECLFFLKKYGDPTMYEIGFVKHLFT